MNTMTRILAILLVPIALALAGCTASPSSTEPMDLSGEWTYSNGSTAFDAEVKSGIIYIYLNLEDTRGLYRTGTFEDLAVEG